MSLPVPRSQYSPSTPARWDPFRDFDNLFGQMSKFMDETFGPREDLRGRWMPPADLTETDDAYLVQVDVPGVRQDDIEIELFGAELRVRGEVKQVEKEGIFRHRTRRTGEFDYRVTLPQDIDADNISARLADGVLTVRAPKSEQTKPRRIEITNR
ncbi:Hsp20/alpha crystallin family protein [Nocardia sp. JMUB6875]|uniref:Hsp20/alpha crystallin family protein n=1 Tax=Nocardia sp. JMUB6875 TaxID=3158170 RepID=UPI0032E630A8